MSGFLDGIGDTGLGSEDAVVRHLDMSGYAYLSGEDAVFADLRAAGYAHLRAAERAFAYLHVVGNLDEVQFLFIGDGYEGDLRVDAQHAGNGLEPPDIKVCGRSAAGIQRLLDAVYWQRMADWEVLNGPYWES